MKACKKSINSVVFLFCSYTKLTVFTAVNIFDTFISYYLNAVVRILAGEVLGVNLFSLFLAVYLEEKPVRMGGQCQS